MWTSETSRYVTARCVHLDGATVAAMRAWRRCQKEDRLGWGAGWQDTGYVFTREDGVPIRPDWFTRTFRRLTVEAGLPPLTPHGLRHSAATFQLDAGTPVTVVAEMLGHSSTRVPQMNGTRYASTRAEDRLPGL